MLVPYKHEYVSAYLSFFNDAERTYYYLTIPLKKFDNATLTDLLHDWDNGEQDILMSMLVDNQPVGLISVDNIDFANRSCEIGVAVTDRAMRGRGLGKAAIKLLLAHIKTSMHRVYARVAVGNTRSRSLFESLGFTYEGTLRDVLRRDDGYLDMDMLGYLGE